MTVRRPSLRIRKRRKTSNGNHIDLPPDKSKLAQEAEHLAAALSTAGVGDALVAALRRGAAGLREELGVVTMRQQVGYFAARESTHLAQIQRLVAVSGEGKE